MISNVFRRKKQNLKSFSYPCLRNLYWSWLLGQHRTYRCINTTAKRIIIYNGSGGTACHRHLPPPSAYFVFIPSPHAAVSRLISLRISSSKLPTQVWQTIIHLSFIKPWLSTTAVLSLMFPFLATLQPPRPLVFALPKVIFWVVMQLSSSSSSCSPSLLTVRTSFYIKHYT